MSAILNMRRNWCKMNDIHIPGHVSCIPLYWRSNCALYRILAYLLFILSSNKDLFDIYTNSWICNLEEKSLYVRILSTKRGQSFSQALIGFYFHYRVKIKKNPCKNCGNFNMKYNFFPHIILLLLDMIPTVYCMI